MIDTWTLVCLLTIVGFAGALLGLFVGHLHAGQQAAEREAKLRAELADAHGARPLVIDSLVDLQEELLAKSRENLR